MHKFKKNSKFFIAAIIPLVLMLFINSSVNKHQHILANGQIIVHAHPYQLLHSETSGQNHKHSNEELAFFALISNPLTLVLFIFAALIAFLQSFNKKSEIYNFQFNFSDYFFALKNKAPPLPEYYF